MQRQQLNEKFNKPGFAFIMLCFFLNISQAQDDSFTVRSETFFSKKIYKVFYPSILKSKTRDSIVISDALQNIEDCLVQRNGNVLAIAYISNGTNKVTKGRTLNFERYIMKTDKFILDNHSILYYAAGFLYQRFSYAFKGTLQFICRTNPGDIFSYNLLEFDSMEMLRDRISDDLKRSACK